MDPAFGLTLWKVLAGLLALAVCTRNWRTAGVGVALLVNWAVNTAIPDMPSGIWPWPAWAAIDLASGFVILLIARDRVLMAIGLVYLFEVAGHLAFGVVDILCGPPPVETYALYWQTTHWGAWGQAWLLLLGGIRGGVEMVGAGGAGDRSGFLGDVRRVALGTGRTAAPAQTKRVKR